MLSILANSNNYVKPLGAPDGFVEGARTFLDYYGNAGKPTYSTAIEDVLGPSLESNGDFTEDTAWTKSGTTTIANGLLNVSGVTAYDWIINQNRSSNITSGKTYKVTYKVSTQIIGSVQPRIFGNVGTARNTPGIYEDIIVAGSVDSLIGLLAWSSSAFEGAIDYFYIQEVQASAGSTYVKNGFGKTPALQYASHPYYHDGVTHYTPVKLDVTLSETVFDASFDDTTYWNEGTGVTVTGGNLVFNTAGNSSVTQTASEGFVGIEAGGIYRVGLICTAYSSASYNVRVQGGGTGVKEISQNITATGRYYDIYEATYSDPTISVESFGGVAASATFSEITVAKATINTAAIVYWSKATKQYEWVASADFVLITDSEGNVCHKLDESWSQAFGLPFEPTQDDMDYMNARMNAPLEHFLGETHSSLSFTAADMAPAYMGFPVNECVIDIDSYLEGVNTTTNGTLDTDTNWSKGVGWTISSGEAHYDGTGTNSALYQPLDASIVSGAYVLMEMDITAISGGGAYMRCGGETTGQIKTTIGHYAALVKYNGVGSQLNVFLDDDLATVSVDNITAKVVTGVSSIYAYTSNVTSNYLNTTEGPNKLPFTIDATGRPTAVDTTLMHFNGDERCVDTKVIPDLSNDIILEWGQYFVADGGASLSGVATGNEFRVGSIGTNLPTVKLGGVQSASTSVPNGFHFIQMIYNSTAHTYDFYVDGVIKNANVAVTELSPTDSFTIGAVNYTSILNYPCIAPVNHARYITDVTQIANYDAAAEYAKWQARTGV